MKQIRIRDPQWKKFVSGTRDKHPGSASLYLPLVSWDGRARSSRGGQRRSWGDRARPPHAAPPTGSPTVDWLINTLLWTILAQWFRKILHMNCNFLAVCGSEAGSAGSVYVLGPPGSGSSSTRNGFGSFNYQAKIVRNSYWFLYGVLSLKNYVIVASKSNR